MIWEVPKNAPLGHLQHIDNPPKQLFVNAKSEQTFAELMQKPRVAVVGTRAVTSYGENATRELVRELAARGIVIISGLALGIDGIAHRTALEANGYTIAVLPTALDHIYPRSHAGLARKILQCDGAIVSEYVTDDPIFKTNFIARNRIVAGMADALLVTEAAEKSGAMHTATFALNQGLTVFAVPGDITRPTSVGTNNLLKRGATPVTKVSDILQGLHLPGSDMTSRRTMRIRGVNNQEQLLINLIQRGVTDGNALLEQCKLTVQEFNHHMTMLEITAKIRPLGANHWGLG